MLRKVGILLCLAGIVSASHIHHGLPVGTQPVVQLSTPAPPQSYYDIPLEAKILQSKLATKLQQPVAFTSQEHPSQFQESFSGGQAYINKPSATYSINAAVVKTLTPVAVPVENKVTVEAHQHVTAHPPTATRVLTEPVPIPVQPAQYHIQRVSRPTIQYVHAPVENTHAVNSAGQFASNTLHETVTVHPPSAAYVTSTLPPTPLQYAQPASPQAIRYVSAPVNYNVNSEVVNTVSSVPVGEKVTIEAHQSVTAHPPAAAYVTEAPVVSHSVRHPELQLFSASVGPTVVPSVQFAPQAPQTYITSTVAPLPVRQIQTVVNRPAVKLLPAPVIPTVRPFIPVATNTFQTVTAFPPSAAYITSTEAPLSVDHAQTIVSRPAVQYVSTVKPALVKSSIASDTVTIESHQSVTAHPPTTTVVPIPVQTNVNPPLVQHISAPITSTFDASSVAQHTVSAPISSSIVTKPIPVPVYFSAEEDEGQQYLTVTKHTQTAPVLQVPAPVRQPIPVPVLYPGNEAYIRYNHKVSTPLVYTKSIVEKDHVSADLVATHVRPGYAYSRAVTYSPASAVSSVRFNGLGVNYGW